MTPAQTFETYQSAVRTVARSVCRSGGASHDQDDMYQVGCLALLEMQIDELGEKQCGAYVHQRLHGGMMDELRRSDAVSRKSRRLLRDIDDTAQTLSHVLARPATPTEVCEHTGLTLTEYFAAKQAAYVAARSDVEGEELPIDPVFLIQCSQAAPDDPLAILHARETSARLAAAVERLTPRQREAIVGRYVEEKTGEQLAAEMRITQGRVSQLQSEAIIKLRELLKESPR
jgi:RNA polymerase sigma factor for flagellar operon FliA